MIMKETIVKVSDNSGAKYACCIGLYNNRTRAQIGDVILVSIKIMYKNLKGNINISVGKVCKAIVIRTRRSINRGFHYYRFTENAVVLVDNQLNPIGNRIFGSTIRLDNHRQINHKKTINITEKTF